MYDDDDEIDDMDADVEIDESKIAEDPTMILTNSTPQVQRLLIYLQKFSESHESSNPMKGLIFVERRHSAKILCHIIRRFVNSYPKLNIRVDFMTGYNSQITDSIETLLAKKCNDRVLEKFKRDELNLIICTSVLEEGIDLQECNLVIAYDLPKHYRSYVQTRGRARMSRSEYVIMTPLGETQKLQKNIAEWSIINDILKKVFIFIGKDLLYFLHTRLLWYFFRLCSSIDFCMRKKVEYLLLLFLCISYRNPVEEIELLFKVEYHQSCL